MIPGRDHGIRKIPTMGAMAEDAGAEAGRAGAEEEDMEGAAAEAGAGKAMKRGRKCASY